VKTINIASKKPECEQQNCVLYS